MKRTVICKLSIAILLASGLTCQCLAISTSAASAVVMEKKTGRVLYEQAADEQRLIASITKIMTAMVALEHGDIAATYTVTAEDMAEGSSMYLRPGDVLSLEELLYGLMLASGNDAALAVAHCVSGDLDVFVEEMNLTARRLGMDGSSFANPNGLDQEGHYSTARDMATLAAYAMDNETFRRIVSTSSITIGERYLKNHNKLLSLCEGCIGIKTGYTKVAGRTLVSAAERNGMTLICVTLKDGDDWNDHINLYDHGFDTYRMETVAEEGSVLASTAVCGGEQERIDLIACEELCYPVADGEKLTLCVRIPLSVSAPVASGQVIGTACLYLEGREVGTVALAASVSVEAADKAKESGILKFFSRER